MGEINIGVSGHLLFRIENHDTGAIREYEYDNIATNALLNRISQWISGVNNTGQNPAATPSKFQLGTGTGTPAKTDQALFTPVAASIINISAISSNSSQQTIISINYPQNTITGTFTEGGLLDLNSVLLTHVLLTPSIAIGVNETVTLIYTITLSST